MINKTFEIRGEETPEEQEVILNHFTEKVKQNPNDQYSLNALGTVFYLLEDIDLAIYYLQKAEEAGESDEERLFYLGWCYFEKKNYAKALSCYIKAYRLVPNYFDCITQIGRCHYIMEAYHQALLFYKLAEEIKPEDLYVIRKIVDCHAKLGHTKRMWKYLKIEKTLGSKTAYTSFRWGYFYTEENNFKKALSYFLKGIEYDPTFIDNWSYAGWCYYNFKAYEKSFLYFSKAYELNPNDTCWVLNYMGLYYLKTNREAQAIPYFEKSYELDRNRNNPWVLNQLGWCFKRCDRLEEALSNYLKAHAMRPDYHWNLNEIGYVYNLMKNFEKSLEFHLKGYALHKEARIAKSIAWRYTDLNDKASARKWWYTLAEMNDKDDDMLWELAWSYFTDKELDKAETYFKKFMLVDDKEYHVYMNLGHIALCNKKEEEALQYHVQGLKIVDSHNEYKKGYLSDWKYVEHRILDKSIFEALLDKAITRTYNEL